MISDEERVLLRLAVEQPAIPGALDVYRDWLLIHDPPRGERMAKRLLDPSNIGADGVAEPLWRAALGLPKNEESTNGMFFNPLPYFVYLRASPLDTLGPVLDLLPDLEVHLDFRCPSEDEAARIVAQPAFAKIRRLHWSSYADFESNENYQSVDRRYAGNEVVAALCASPNVAGLEHLEISEPGVDPIQGAALVAGPFRNLRRLVITSFVLGDANVAALAGSPVGAKLRQLELRNQQIEDRGALAIAKHLVHLEKLDLRWNKIGPEAQAALRAMPNLRELLID